MHSPEPLLLVISGPSGVGKDAVLESMKANQGSGVHFAITATTRLPRPGESDGVNHYFLSPERFEEMRAGGELLESAEVYGRWYGVPRAPVRNALGAGLDVIARVDIQGARSIRKLAPDAVLVFIAPPSIEELERRLRQRKTESEEQLAKRLRSAREEMAEISWFDHVIPNETDAVEDTVERIVAIMKRERRRTLRRVVTI